MIKIHTPMHN